MREELFQHQQWLIVKASKLKQRRHCGLCFRHGGRQGDWPVCVTHKEYSILLVEVLWEVIVVDIQDCAYDSLDNDFLNNVKKTGQNYVYVTRNLMQ